MKLLITAAAIVLSASAAYAEQRTTYSKTTTSDGPIKEDSAWSLGDKEAPYDFSNINQSPIRGKGRISVVHNEPAPGDPDRKLHDALWLLQDNSWTCYKPIREGKRK